MGNAHFPRFCPFYRWGQWSSEESGVGQGHPANWISTQGHGTGLNFSFCFHLKHSHICIHLEGRFNCLKPGNWWNMRKSCAVRPCVLQLSTELEIAGAPGWVWNLSLAAGFGVCRGELWLLFKSLRWKWGSAWVWAHVFLCLLKWSCLPVFLGRLQVCQRSAGISKPLFWTRGAWISFPQLTAGKVESLQNSSSVLNLDCFIWHFY